MPNQETIFFMVSCSSLNQLIVGIIKSLLAYSISDAYIVLSKERGGEGYEICFGCNYNTAIWIGYNKGDASNNVGTYKKREVSRGCFINIMLYDIANSFM